ncbi:MAG: hypothetical protein NTV38_06060, partial [Chloroflexi bacterium]|nr:hypothetical protein [Chloroflexota bacterium]
MPKKRVVTPHLVWIGLAVCGISLVHATIAQEGNSDPKARSEVTPISVDIRVDTNNDGTIDQGNNGENTYKMDTDGLIVAIDLSGDSAGALDIKPVQLKIINNPGSGHGTLHCSTQPGAVDAWVDAAATQPLTLPKTWDLSKDTVPSTIYITGKTLGTGFLFLTAATTGNNPGATGTGVDSTMFTVVKTPCWAPVGTFAYIWEPCPWSIGWAGDAFCSQVEDYGWNVTACRFYDLFGWDSDPGYCTMQNFKNVASIGLLCLCAHSGCTGSSVAAEYFGTQGAADAWRGSEAGMSSFYSEKLVCWFVNVPDTWFASNWAPNLNIARAITWWYCCTQYPCARAAGGRVTLGYDCDPDFSGNTTNLGLFFGRMTGHASGWDVSKRRAGEAYAGALFQWNLQCTATDPTLPPWHTTLSAAPLRSGPMSIRTKGAGYVVFDTYMNDSIAANDAVAKTGGAASISDRRWFGTVYGKYGISFDFTWANDNLQLRAFGTKCMNKGFQYT